MFILGFPVPVYTPCAYRELSYWQRSGVNTERRTFRVRARRSSTNFTPCSSTVRAVFTRRTSPRDLSTDSGLGCRSVFLGQFERGIIQGNGQEFGKGMGVGQGGKEDC